MPHLPIIDLLVLVAYLGGIAALGGWFAWRQKTADDFMSAGRSLPGWALGLSIFGSYISSISFLANPGASYGGNWNLFAFSLAMPLAAWLAVRYFIPFYRQRNELSAYTHLEERFGAWACTYAVICFLLTQLARMGTILFLLVLALQPLVGGDVRLLIVCAGTFMTLLPLVGGTEGVIWTGVVQSLVIVLGVVACLLVLLLGMPLGAGQVFTIAAEQHKFSLGSFAGTLTESTFWVVLVYGLTTHLQNLSIDQSYVQRYVTARSDADAARSVWLGTALYIPLAAAFFFIGTALFAFYQAYPDRLPLALQVPGQADKIFPYFIAHELPLGMTGLLIAAICAAAMDSNLHCCATLVLCDLYKRYLRPHATEREAWWVLRLSVVLCGAAATYAAVWMIEQQSVLEAWWKLAGIFSGGVLGLFLLGMLSQVSRPAAATGVALGIVTILWLTLSPLGTWPFGLLKNPLHPLLTMVIGTLVIFLCGLLLSFWIRPRLAKPQVAHTSTEISEVCS